MKLKLCCLLAAAAVTAQAEVWMPKIFGNNMVLQQNTALPVWGKAAPAEKVTVMLDGDIATAVAGKDGKWMVKLASRKLSAKPVEMTVKGEKNELKFSNILIGDVWLASGQSNMRWLLSQTDTAKEFTDGAKYPEIRFFVVMPADPASTAPQDDCAGSWEVLSPGTAGKMSGVAFHFARDLYLTYKEPLGVIVSAWGGTAAQAWVSEEVLAKQFQKFLKTRDNIINNMTPKYAQKYKEELLPAYEKALKDWKANKEAAYLEHFKKIRETGKRTPPPNDLKPPREPGKPGVPANCPAGRYNAQINPIIPYAICGAIWYQGEHNSGDAQYDTYMAALIKEWRTRWGLGDFPFFFVQLANWIPHKASADRPAWAITRECQARTLAVPNTGMALAIDVGNPRDIHPRDKQTVGKRLALLEKKRRGADVVARGPNSPKVEFQNGKARVSFEGAKELKTKDGGKNVKAFMLAGEDRKFYPAGAEISGKNTVTAHCPEVKNPAFVRYAWADNPEVNLYNEADLPAEPFRTDK